MKIDASSLLKALGITIPQSVNAHNSKCVCPLHGDVSGEMKVVPNRATGQVSFVCMNPACGFRGDAIALVAAMRRIPVKEAVALFAPGGELAGTLSEPMTEAEMSAYIDGRNTQATMAEYMRRCVQALKLHPERSNLRAGLSQATLRLVPDQMGLLLVDDDMPREFYEFRKAKYRHSCLVCMPFTFNGEITHVDVYDASTPSFRFTVPVTRSDAGVFLEAQDHPRTTLATEDAMAAAVIYSGLRTDTVKTPPVLCAAGFPLPEAYEGCKNITFVSTVDYPVSLDYMLDLLCATEYVSGSRTIPIFHVWDTSRMVRDIRNDAVASVLSPSAGSLLNRLTPQEYVAKLLNTLHSQHKLQSAADAFRRHSLSPVYKRMIRDEVVAKGYAQEILDLLTDVDVNLSDVTLANGRVFKVKPSELCAVTNSGMATICNVGIVVKNKIRAFDGNELLVCMVTSQDPDIPPATVRLPESCWGSAKSIKNLVVKAFTAAGHVPYVAFYDVPGYKWDDILGRLAEKCPLSREIAELGIDETADFNMPEFTIRGSSMEIDVQNRVFTLPDAVLRVYSGIPGVKALSPLEPVKRLLEHCDNLYVAAFTCGLMHVVYQMSYAKGAHGKVRYQAPRHLFFVETEAGIWGGVFKQLSDLFGGSDFTPTVSYADPGSTLDLYAQLGTLPLIAYVPSMGQKLAQAMDSHTVALVGLVDSTTAVMANGHVSAMYVMPSNEKPVNARIATENIEAIRETFASFMALYLSQAKIDSAYRTSQAPCLAAYAETCRICGVAERPELRTIAQTYFPGSGMTGVNTFFDMLHRGLLDDRRQTRLCVLNEAPQKGYSFTGRGQHVFVLADRVIIGHNVVDLVNRASSNVFAIDQLSRELEERNMLEKLPDELNLDPKRCWCIPRDLWQSNVIRPPVQLRDPVSSSSVQLEPLV